MRQKLILAAKFLVSIALVGVVVWRIDADRLAMTLGEADPAIVAFAALQLVLQPFVGTVRWRTIVRALGARLPFGQASRLVFIAIFFNQVLPGAVAGDGLRIWLAQRQGLNWRQAIHSVAADRLLMLGLLLVMVLAAVPVLEVRLGFEAAEWLIPVSVMAAILAIAAIAGARAMPAGWLRLRLLRWAHDLAEDLRLLLFRPGPAMLLLANGLLAYASLWVTFWLLGLAVGAAIPVTAYLLVVPPILLASVLPVSIGGWGVREAAALALLTAVGATDAQAVAISVLFGLVSLAVAVPGLVLWLLGRIDARRQSRAAAGDPAAPAI